MTSASVKVIVKVTFGGLEVPVSVHVKVSAPPLPIQVPLTADPVWVVCVSMRSVDEFAVRLPSQVPLKMSFGAELLLHAARKTAEPRMTNRFMRAPMFGVRVLSRVADADLRALAALGVDAPGGQSVTMTLA